MSIVGTRPPLISETNLYEPHHKVIIIVMLAVLNKENIHFGKYGSLILLILLETVLIVTIGFCLNLIIRRLPTVVNIIFTGGRNEHHNKEKKQY